MNDLPQRLAAALADRYTIERELGQGGMATVHLAHDVKHDRRVALKVLRPELAAVLGAERFVQEIKTTAALQHPHILPLFDSGTADGFLFYVMPYIDGETLRAKLDRETQLGIDEAVRITRETADALDYAHRSGVIHRDIKPENILLHDGRPMVADFGIALAVSAAAGGRMTETGLSLGTPHYMSPEQATAEKEITARSDVYSLASVLYEMLAGQPPHLGGSAQQIIMKIIAEPVDPVTRYRKSVPPNVAAAVAKALEKLPADRFESAKAFSDALANPAFTTASATDSASGTPAGRGGVSKRLFITAVAVTLLAGAAGGLMFERHGLVAPLVRRQRIELWQRPPEPFLVAFGLAISPDGNTIVFVDSVGGTQRLWAKERDRLEATVLTGTNDATVPVFSPDGQWVAFFADGKLKKVPRLGGSAVTIADSVNSVLPAIAWLDDGTIAFNNAAYGLVLVGQDGGPVRRVIGADSLRGGVVSATPLPGGKAVLLGLCAAGCSTSHVAALDVRAAAVPQDLADDGLKAWAAPGGTVAFVRRDGGVFAGAFDRDRLAFKGAPVPVLDGVRAAYFAADMAVGTSGTLLYATGAPLTRNVEAVWVSRQGVVAPVDSAWSFSPGDNFSPALSPDGQRVAVSTQVGTNQDIWIRELAGGRQSTRLTFGENIKLRPAWTADGRSVVYVVRPPEGETTFVASRHADGTGGEVTLLESHHPPLNEVEPTRDTAQFIVRTGNTQRDIALYTLGTDSLVPLLTDPGYSEMGAALSPDGRWLAYTSDETGRNEVYVRPFPNVRDGHWPVSANGGTEPQWSHSGHELFFRDADGGFIAAQRKPGPTFAIATQERLFDVRFPFVSDDAHRAYAVAPGDDRFLFFRVKSASDGARPASLVMVEHWFEELKARDTGKKP